MPLTGKQTTTQKNNSQQLNTFPGDPKMSQQILDHVESNSLKTEIDKFEIGDTVDVHNRILEGNKERTQVFNGVVIARSGAGSREMFTVRRIVSGEGVERKFPVHSPKIAKIVVKRSGVTRRAKLYYLRDRIGKAVRLRVRLGMRHQRRGGRVCGPGGPALAAGEEARAQDVPAADGRPRRARRVGVGRRLLRAVLPVAAALVPRARRLRLLHALQGDGTPARRAPLPAAMCHRTPLRAATRQPRAAAFLMLTSGWLAQYRSSGACDSVL